MLKNYFSDDNWDDKDAEVVCRMMNFSTPTAWSRATKKSTFGHNMDANYIMDDVRCVGTELKLDYCPNKYYHDCNVGEAAGVICYGKYIVCFYVILMR